METTELKLSLIAEHAKRNDAMQFTSLAHLLNAAFLRTGKVSFEASTTNELLSNETTVRHAPSQAIDSPSCNSVDGKSD